jgi:hypothetical protein
MAPDANGGVQAEQRTKAAPYDISARLEDGGGRGIDGGDGGCSRASSGEARQRARGEMRGS